jgi:hypothetical protein
MGLEKKYSSIILPFGDIQSQIPTEINHKKEKFHGRGF